MATTKNWGASGADQIKLPCSTRYFADGDASNWCVHTVPAAIKAISIENAGATDLYVAVGPALTGSSSSRATAHAERIAAGERALFVLDGGGGPVDPTFSTSGGDGAAHPMRIRFEARS